MSRNGHEKFNSSALTTLTSPERKRGSSRERGMWQGFTPWKGKGEGRVGTQSQQLLLLLLLDFVLLLLWLLQLESHPSRTTKHVIFGQTMHDTHSRTHTDTTYAYVLPGTVHLAA